VPDEAPDKAAIHHAWRYFELHAAQRMSLFNFYLILSGLVLAGIAGSYARPSLQGVDAVLGVILALVALIFWKLDQRACFLMKRAELVLAEMECVLPVAARLFRSEPEHTEGAGQEQGVWTYGKSFRLVFWCTGIAGLALSIPQMIWQIGSLVAN
jgi:hypothetical protein